VYGLTGGAGEGEGVTTLHLHGQVSSCADGQSAEDDGQFSSARVGLNVSKSVRCPDRWSRGDVELSAKTSNALFWLVHAQVNSNLNLECI
jgi:hypothetical protein